MDDWIRDARALSIDDVKGGYHSNRSEEYRELESDRDNIGQ
jgi:hypothetical protein